MVCNTEDCNRAATYVGNWNGQGKHFGIESFFCDKCFNFKRLSLKNVSEYHGNTLEDFWKEFNG